MEPDGSLPAVPGFIPGAKVWPTEGPMILQSAPQTVLATCRHPVAGDWLWLDDGQCGFGSWAAAYWTTEEPGEAEKAARAERMRCVGEFADYAGRILGCPVSPILPVPVDEPAPGADMPLPRRWDYPLTGLCGDPVKDGCQHVMTGGCPIACFQGPCRFEVASGA